MKSLIKYLIIIELIVITNDCISQSIIWRQILGGPYVDIAYNCIQSRDGGYLMAGYKEIEIPGQNFQVPKSYLVKFDSYGNIMWEKIIGDSLMFNISLTVAEDSHGNIFLPYYTEFAHLVKLNSKGQVLWDRDFSSANIYTFRGISFEDNFRNLVLLGMNVIQGFYYTSSITKLDSNGNLIWTKAYYDSIPSISVYSSGNNSFYFSDDGYYISGAKGVNPFIIKTDTVGNVIWNKRYLDNRGIYSIAPLSTSNFIVSCQTDSGYLMCKKIDSSGIVIWSRNYRNDSLARYTGANKIIRSSKNDFALGTISGHHFGRLLIIDSLGNILSSKFYNYPENFLVNQNNINNTSDSGYIVAGHIREFPLNDNIHGDKLVDILVFKIDKYGNSVLINTNNIYVPEEFTFDIFPNPFNINFGLRLKIIQLSNVNIAIFDVAGRFLKEIFKGELKPGEYAYNVSTPELSSGIYFLKVQTTRQLFSKKILLIK